MTTRSSVPSFAPAGVDPTPRKTWQSETVLRFQDVAGEVLQQQLGKARGEGFNSREEVDAPQEEVDGINARLVLRRCPERMLLTSGGEL